MKVILLISLITILVEKILCQIQQKDTTFEVRLSYSPQLKQFISSYRDDNQREKYNGFENKFLSREQNKLNQHNILANQKDPKQYGKAYQKIYSSKIQTDLSLHTYIEAYFGRNQYPLKLSFDLNLPYNWIQSPNFQICYNKNDAFNKNNNNKSQESRLNVDKIIKENIIESSLDGGIIQCQSIKESSKDLNKFSFQNKNNVSNIKSKNLNSKDIDCFQSQKQIDLNCRQHLFEHLQSDLFQFLDETQNIQVEFYVKSRQFINSKYYQSNQTQGFIGFPIEQNQRSIIQEYKNLNITRRNSFSLYLYYDPTNLIQPSIVIGGVNHNYFEGKLQYITMNNHNGQYSFKFDDIIIGKTKLLSSTQINQKQNNQDLHLRKEIQHAYDQNQKQNNVIEQKTGNMQTEQNQSNKFVGVLSTKELFIQIPQQSAEGFINILKNQFKIRCKRNTDKIIECLKQKSAQFPDFTIEISDSQIENESKQIKLKSEYYIWECRKIKQKSSIKPYFTIDYQSMQNVQNSIENYELCKTFFQVDENNLHFTFGFSFLEKFYIDFDLDNQQIGFSDISRKSIWVNIINHSKLSYMIGPLTIFMAGLFYFFSFYKKYNQNQIITLNQNQFKQKHQDLLIKI